MPRRQIEHLTPASHKDVKPMYSEEEILDKLATVVNEARERGAYRGINPEQGILFEVIYSLAKAVLK
jgi:hypothetical protein